MAKKKQSKAQKKFLLDVGTAMKFIRQKKGMTQGDVVRATGFERSYISRLEANKVIYPRIETLYRLCRALNVSLNDFLILSMGKKSFGCDNEDEKK